MSWGMLTNAIADRWQNASAEAANSDFFDSLNLDGLTVERAWVNNDDDCFSPKANTSNIYVNQMYCNGIIKGLRTRHHLLPGM